MTLYYWDLLREIQDYQAKVPGYLCFSTVMKAMEDSFNGSTWATNTPSI
jgi:hypothetical protein